MQQTRTIHRLQLRCERESDVRGVAIRFEDALRTATLPDTGGRLIFVRRLDLGQIRRDSTSMTLSLLIAEAFEREKPSCVHGGDANAEAAPAIWFRDALEAHTLLAQRVLAGARCDAWFWRKAVPNVPMDAPTAERLRAIVLSLAATPEAPTAIPQWVAALVRAGHAYALMDIFDSPTLAMLERTVGATSAAERNEYESGGNDVARSSIARSHRLSSISDSAQRQSDIVAVLERWFAKLGDVAALSELRRSLNSAYERYGVLDGDGSHERKALESVSRAQAKVQAAAENETTPPTRESRSEHADSRIRNARGDRTNDENDGARVPSDIPKPITQTDAPQRDEVSQDVVKDRAWGLRGEETSAGGIGFLFGALNRLGYAEWLDAQPQWADRAILPRVFARALAAVGAADDDPAWALALAPTMVDSVPDVFFAPQRWREGLCARKGASLRRGTRELGAWTDASGRLLLAAWWREQALPDVIASARHVSSSIALNDPDRVVADAWFIALRRWLRRYAGIGLHDLVCRSARFEMTPTHLDVWFDPAHADLRVRKAGLDIDPGWLPWWGRAVAFHYERLPYADDDGAHR